MTVNNYSNEYRDWCLVKEDHTIFTVREYITQHPNGFFFDDAMELYVSLKEIERERMLTKPSSYSREMLNKMRKEGIFSDNELIEDGIQTERSLGILDNYDQVCKRLPYIQMEIARCRSECSPGCTDLYIWGAPTAGKSSLVTGLIRNRRVELDYQGGCVPYASALLQYSEIGCTIGHTMGDFVPTIEVSVLGNGGTCVNRFNIVETVCDNFALKVAKNNLNSDISLSDMGHGIDSLLRNGNRKVFFFVIDPTKTSVLINRVVSGGQQVCDRVNQCYILQEIIELMERPENADIMRKVDSLHIIVTKADELAKNREMRDKHACELLRNNYLGLINSINHLCQQYDINFSTNYQPRTHTFSLGDFYASGFYEYDQCDSDKLVDVLFNTTSRCTKQTFQNRLRSILNIKDNNLGTESALLSIMTMPFVIFSSGVRSVIKSLKKIKKYPKQYGTTFSPTEKSSAYTNVYSSIFAPGEISRKSRMLVQVYLHLFEETEKVKSLAQESQKDAERRDYIPLQCKLKKGDKVDVLLNIYGEALLMSDKKSVIWQDTFTKCSFDYFVPKDIEVDELSCMALLTVNEIPVGEMRFITKIVESPRKLNPEIFAHKYNKVFISYSHKDEPKVKFLHEGLAMGGVPHFFDRSYLKPGDIFPKVIQDYINSADLFVLCWSENAAQSEYVMKERIQALERAYPKVPDGRLLIYPMSIEPRAELPCDMRDNYHFGEV